MFVLATLLYPLVLALLCAGAGLLVDRLSGGFLPGALLPALGAAALIGVSQLATYAVFAAPATPYLLAACAVAGFALGRRRLRVLWRRARRCGWQLAVPALAFVVALAPVLFSGRPSFSSYGILTDSAFHMLGADYLIRHGQDYAHLDLRNSYGQYLNDYYNMSYPSGADTLFGGSALLVRVPLIWAFQPFNACMLALASCPALVLARRVSLDGALGALCALTVTVPALVYGYELIASVKEIAALPMILTLGALVALHPRWLRGPLRGVAPLALVAAAGVSALGVAFGAWALTAVLVLAALALGHVLSGRQRARRPLLLLAAGAIVAFVAALETWLDVSGSLHVAQNIASTGNPGNLQQPLRTVQLFGTWLVDSYKHVPAGAALTLSYVLSFVALAGVLLGAVYIVLCLRAYALACWIAFTLVVWVALTAFATTWANGKALMLTSPVVILLAWAGVAALLRASAGARPAGARAAVSQPRFRPVFAPAPRWALPRALRRGLRPAALLLALALVGGVVASDAIQYHDSNLAPTARYEELASIGSRFAGRGPTLFTDYDEYSLYLLRDLDVGGPSFMYPPRGLALAHGLPVDLAQVPPAALRAYPLIVTRRDPSASRPPAAYRLLWQGTYYQVWGRSPGALAALAQLGSSASPAGGRADGSVVGPAGGPAGWRTIQCARIAGLARVARSHGARLIAAAPPELVRVPVTRDSASRPAAWADTRLGLLMSRPGRLTATFAVPHAGVWDLWLQGEIMPAVRVSVDGRLLASIGGQLTGVATDPDTIAPLRVRLAAGRHRLTIARGASDPLAPGAGGSAILDAAFLTPATGAGSQATLRVVGAARWRSLCGRRLEWVEAVRR